LPLSHGLHPFFARAYARTFSAHSSHRVLVKSGRAKQMEQTPRATAASWDSRWWVTGWPAGTRRGPGKFVAAWYARRVPGVPDRPAAPNAFRHRQAKNWLTPNQCMSARELSVRTARARAAFTHGPVSP